MAKKQKKIREITFGIVITWILIIFFGLSGLGFLLDGKVIAGVSLILACLVLHPKINKLIEEKFHFKLSVGLKAVIVIILFLIYAFNVETQPTEDIQKVIEPIEQVQEKIIPTGKYYENTGNGITLIITNYTFEKKSDSYGKLKDIEFILQNHQGSKSIFPNLIIYVIDKRQSDFSVQKEIELSEFIANGDYIQKKVTVDLTIAKLENPKELKVAVIDWPDVPVSVSFETDFAEGFS